MNRAKLTTLLEALKAAIGDVDHDLATNPPDEFVAHIYRARRSYQHQLRTKHSKRREDEAIRSYQKALEFGFRGSSNAWLAILAASSKELPKERR